MTHASKASKWVTFAVLLAGSVIMILPFFWMVSSAFKPVGEVYQFPPSWLPKNPTLDNFQEMFRRIPFWRYFGNSLLVTSCQTIATVLLASLAGYGFAKYRFWGRDGIFMMILATMMIPFPVTIISLFLMAQKAGLTNNYAGLILVGVCSAFGVFMMRQFIVSLPDALMEAARMDGATEFRIYLQIILPLIRPALATLTIFTFMGAWNAFIWPLLIINQDSLRTLPLGIATFSSQYYDAYHLQMAASTLTIIPEITIFLLLQKQFIKGLALGSLKG